MTKHSKKILWLLLSLLVSSNSGAQRIDLNAWQAASPDAPYDVTAYLQNPDGTQNFGWFRNSSDAAAGYNKHNWEFASSTYNNTGIESWYWSPVKDADLIWQDVEGLFAGTYRITAYVVAQIYNDGSRKGELGQGAFLFAGDKQISISSNKWQELSVTTTLGKDQKLRIGIRGNDKNENDWVSIAGVRVECIGFDGFGTLPRIALDEKFDVSVARQFSMANVVLYRTLSKTDYTPVFFPFDMNKEQCSTYFSEVLLVTDAQTTGNGVELVTTASEEIKAETPYLVKGKKDGRTRIEMTPTTINGLSAATKTLPGGWQLIGTFRSHEGLDSNYQLGEGTTMNRTESPSRIDGYSFYLSTNH